MDDTCRVTAVTDGWLYAVGDVNRRALTTHQGKYQARIAGAAIAARAAGTPLDDGRWGAHAATADHTAVPQVVFTTPEVASAGLTAHEAKRTGRQVEVVDYDLARLEGGQQYAEATAAGPAWSSTPNAALWRASPSPGPGSASSSTRRRPPSRERCPSPRSARSGSGSWRPIGTAPVDPREPVCPAIPRRR